MQQNLQGHFYGRYREARQPLCSVPATAARAVVAAEGVSEARVNTASVNTCWGRGREVERVLHDVMHAQRQGQRVGADAGGVALCRRRRRHGAA
jgi:hypothetical protein